MTESLLKCTLKKSPQVLWKIVLRGSYVIVGLTAAAIAYYLAIQLYLREIQPLIGIIAGALASVPWYYYAGAGVIAAIPIYSFLWCVARDLTQEDWKSGAANNSAAAITFATIATITTFATIATITTFATIATITTFAIDPVESTTVWYYIVRFPGAAWHHYRSGKS